MIYHDCERGADDGHRPNPTPVNAEVDPIVALPMIVREYVADLVEHRDYPREARVAMLIQVLSIPWLQDKGPLTIRGDFILASGVIVATIERRSV